MNEATWLACTDPQAMLDFLKGRVSERKLRLYAVACCRRIWPLLTAQGSRRTVEVAERYADGGASEKELFAAGAGTWTSASSASEEAAVRAADVSVWLDARSASHYTAFAAACDGREGNNPGRAELHRFPLLVQAKDAERAAHADLLRDLFGPRPFQKVRLDPAWLTWHDRLVVRLARAAYDERHLPAGTLDNARLAVLADGLEEAGCQDGQILGHLRSGGDHVRGCWAVDLVLGKS